MSIENNLREIQKRIELALETSVQKGTEINMNGERNVSLVGVTKTIDTARVQELVNLGVTILGENQTQEILRKVPLISGAPSWHMIGHLQTNKVKSIIGKVKLIHSVDSIRLVDELQKQAQNAALVIEILLEVNIANEATKHGFSEQELREAVKYAAEKPNIKLNGLMTVAPYVENPESNRIYFKKMRELFIDINKEFINNINMQNLSMGMTNDYAVAIEEGSNMVRIGTGLFGERFYI